MMCERTACDSTRHRHRRKRFGGNLRRDLDTEMDILISIRIWVSCLDSCRTWQCLGLLYAKESASVRQLHDHHLQRGFHAYYTSVPN
jgi:hypothetical protein